MSQQMFVIKGKTLSDIADAIRYASKSTGDIEVKDYAARIKDLEGASPATGKFLYRMGLLSDIHLTTDSRKQKFRNALKYFNDNAADMVCMAGDLGLNSTETELLAYKTIVDDTTYNSIPVYTCMGNHDSMHTEDLWRRYTGNNKNFHFVKNGDVFVFLSFDKQTTTSLNSALTPYTEALAYFKDVCSNFKGARIFAFIHFPLSNYSGLATGQYYGFGSSSTQDDEFFNTMKLCENVVMFHGHTHYEFDAESTYREINIYRVENNDLGVVHIPSCAYPRNAAFTQDESKSQGWMCDVYENTIVLKGIDFITGEQLDEYVYWITAKNNPAISQNYLTISEKEIELLEGASTQVTIGISESADVVVNVTPSNDNVTVSEETLEFTSGGNIQKTITITAKNGISQDVASLITVSADGYTTKLISVNVIDIQEELPSDYTAVEYIESTGTQYINTGVIGKSGYGLRTKVNQTGHSQSTSSSKDSKFIGSYTSDRYQLLDTRETEGAFQFAYGSGSALYFGTFTMDTDYEIESFLGVGNQYFKVGSETIYTGTDATIVDTNLPMFMFGVNRNGAMEKPFSGRAYYAKIFDVDGNIVRDFAPCYRNSDGKAGMYDFVTKTFYTNQASGDDFNYPKPPVTIAYDLKRVVCSTDVTMAEYGKPFNATLTPDDGETLSLVSITMGGVDITDSAYIDGVISIDSITGDLSIKAVANVNLPAGYERLSYIKCSGTQYIDTGIEPTHEMYFNIAFNTNINASQSAYAFGARENKNYYTLCIMPGKYLSANRGGTGVNVNEVDCSNTDIKIRYNHDYGYYAIVRGVKYDKSWTPNSSYPIPTGASIYIFSANNAGAAYHTNLDMKLYKASIVENDTVMHAYIPVKNADNVVGLWDSISEQFIGNAGTGDFIAGEVED